MRAEEFNWFVGIDWASEAHDVVLLDAAGADQGRRIVSHTGAALAELGDWLTAISGGHPERVAIGIELMRGAVVETLLARGLVVVGRNPQQLDRFRDRYTIAGAKDDRRDAFVLAAALRTDRARYRRLAVDPTHVVQLRELIQTHEELQEELGRLTNRLREQLARYYPAVLTLCAAADEPWVWDLLTLVPTPAHGARVRPSRVTRLLGTHRIRRLDADAVITALRVPALHVAPGTVEAASAHVALLLARLRLTPRQRTQCAAQMAALLEDLTSDDPEGDAALLRSLPGVGVSVTAAFLVEARDLLAARDYRGLRAHSGVAPVTRQSGKRRTVTMRRACSARLRQATFHWARCSALNDPHSRAIYDAARQRGHSHGRALRGLADCLLRVLIAMLTTRTPYDPSHQRRAA